MKKFFKSVPLLMTTCTLMAMGAAQAQTTGTSSNPPSTTSGTGTMDRAAGTGQSQTGSTTGTDNLGNRQMPSQSPSDQGATGNSSTNSGDANQTNQGSLNNGRARPARNDRG